MLTPCDTCAWFYEDPYGEWDGCVLSHERGYVCPDYEEDAMDDECTRVLDEIERGERAR